MSGRKHNAQPEPRSSGSAPAPTEQDIQAWLIARLENELELPQASLNVKRPVSRYGLDSLAAVTLTAELEDWLQCQLSLNVLNDHPSVESLARHLSECVSSKQAEQLREAVHEPTKLAGGPAPWSPLQRIVRGVLSALVRLLCRLECSGEFADCAGCVLAVNHLHVVDTPILFSLLPWPASFFVSEHMKSFRIAHWFLAHVANTIWVSRGQGDVQALQAALSVLRSGGIVAVAPEGRISKGGGLLQGRTGTAYLATQAKVPVLPVVAYGQERMFRSWVRLRRAPVKVRIGKLIHLPAGGASTRELETYTNSIMLELARMLPEEYRGVYKC